MPEAPLEPSSPTTSQPTAPTPASPATPPPEPLMPPPSPTVQPFISGGGPPPALVSPAASTGNIGRTLIIVFGLFVLLAAAVLGYFYFGQQLKARVGLAQTAPTALRQTPTDYAAGLPAALKSLDVSTNGLDTSLASADSSLSDKPGDLSE